MRSGRLILDCARDGGYFVTSSGAYGEMAEILFTGTLTECADYMVQSFDRANHAISPSMQALVPSQPDSTGQSAPDARSQSAEI